MWQDQWRWHRGEPAAPPAKANGDAASAASTADAAAIATLAAQLDDVTEPAGLSAAYALGALGQPAVRRWWTRCSAMTARASTTPASSSTRASTARSR